jgi:hypothetical protein
MNTIFKRLLLLPALLIYIDPGKVLAQSVPSTSVHQGLAIETASMDAGSKKAVFDRFNEIISPINNDHFFVHFCL